MNKIVSYTTLVLDHYKKFGKNGISLLLKSRNKENKILQIKPPELPYPIQLRNHTTDLPMFYCIYAKREMDAYLDFEPTVIVDCGSHIGLSAVLFANRYPNAKIFAIEPETSNFEMLVENTKPYNNIICINKGIWNENTSLKIRDEGLGNWGYMTEKTKVDDGENIESISISELMANYGINKIDLCKINIEGAEKELFEKNYDNWLSCTDSIIIELHDHMKPGCTHSFLKAMSSYEFSLSPLGSYLFLKGIKKIQ
jgi:FkbM family methyltransferase